MTEFGRIGRTLAYVAAAVVILIVSAGLLRGQPWLDMLLFGVALAVAVVPEALPAVVSISLAFGVQRTVRRNALIRRLPAVETLGATTIICSDKTGTLTLDQMTARRIWTTDHDLTVRATEPARGGQLERDGQPIEPPPTVIDLLRAGTLASDVQMTRTAEGRCEFVGDPTEVARPAKGAPEVIVAACRHLATATGDVELDPARRAEILAAAAAMADAALRVLAIAIKKNTTADDVEHGLTLLGLIGLNDPPRPEARTAIETCRQAGIRTVMITGDHPRTAAAIARELGLGLGEGRHLTGRELDDMSDSELGAAVLEIDRHRRVARGGRHDPARRQLHLDRRRHRGGARDPRQHRQVPDLPAVVEPG